jgi:hypothetical protein
MPGDIMAKKIIEHNFFFPDIAINSNADRNRSLLFLNTLINPLTGNSIEILLLNYCPTGKSHEGERAYSPLFLILYVQAICL